MEGIICVNKPKGITSFDVVRKLKRVLKEKRIGHTGTLDPMATGVMIVCVGRATKLVQDIESHEKGYIADFVLGYKTDTYDTEGSVVGKSDLPIPNRDAVSDSLSKFKGKINQVPPMYSALKVDGKRLYELAREGIEIERKAREVQIKEIDLLDFQGDKGKFSCKVSKGTYIRSIIFDLGEQLGTFATMTDLVRTEVGKISLKECFELDKIEELGENGDFSFLTPVDKFFNYPQLDLMGEENLKYYKNGNSFSWKAEDGIYTINYQGVFLGLGSVKNNRLQGYKYF